jgi:hypothetical protein
MTLAQALGATSPDDPSDEGYIDPQGVASGLMVQHEPDADLDATADPLTVAQRLLRKHAGATGRIITPGNYSVTPGVPSATSAAAPASFDPSTFADQTKPGAFDPSDFGAGPAEGTEGNPYTGNVEVPDSAIAGAGQALAGGAIKAVGKGIEYAARLAQPLENATPETNPFASEEQLEAEQSAPKPPAEASPIFKAGQATANLGEQIGPTEATQKAHPIATGVFGAIGTTAPLILAGMADPVLAMAGGAALFGASSAEETYEAAKKNGASDETAANAASLNGVVMGALGATNVGLILQPFKKFLPEASGLGVRILYQAIESGITFTGVGEAQEYLGQQIAKMYDPNAGYSFNTERLISEFLAGGALGGLHAAFRRGEAEEQVQPQTGAQPGTGTAQPNAGALPRPGGGGEQTATQTDANNPKYWEENGSFDYAAYQKDNPGYDRNADPNPWQQGAGAQQGGAGAQQGPQGTQQTGPQAPAPEPFKSALKPNIRSKLEDQAVNLGMAEAGLPGTPARAWGQTEKQAWQAKRQSISDDVASWPDDQLKSYVHERTNPQGTQPRNDDAILRQYGLSDDEIKAMSPEDKKIKADEAIANGTVHYEPDRAGTVTNPVNLKTAADVQRAAAVADQDHTPAQGEAGNAQRGHATWNGLGIAIEIPPGGVRRGVVKETGQPWESTHPDAYGEFKDLPDAADGMKPDVVIGSHPNAPTVYVIDELDRKTGEYKQSKAFIGFSTPQDVANSYVGISTKQPGQIGGMRAFGRDEFVKWAKAGGLSKPASDAMKARASGTYNVGAKPGTAASAARDEVSVEPTANAPSVRDHQAIEDALRQVGVDPRHVRPVDIQRAAEIHANEGFSPDDSWQLAVTRAAVEDGLMTPQDVKDDHGAETASAVMAALEPSQRIVRPQARGTSVSGAPAEGESQRISGGGENGAPRGNEAAAHTENEEPVRPAAGEAAELHGEAAGAGRAETERGGAGQRPTGGERAAEANGRPEREAANRNAPEHEPAGTAAQAALIGGEHTVTAADGAKIKVKPEVVEAKNLITSSDKGYDKTLQPRQRDRAASHAQIREIVTNLDPERLGYSAEADRGAPIVGPDRMVESGNGRVAALRVIYRANPAKAKAYKTWLESQGVDVAKYKEPILVRQRVTELGHEERKAFTVAANKPATLEMSAPERATADADAITPHMLDLIKDGDLGSLENRGFVRAFVGTMPASERGNLATTEGGLSSAGLTRVKNAVLAKAYSDPNIVSRITESTDDDVKSISNALVSAAPAWAKMRSDIEAGTVPEELDLTKALVEAVHRTADMRAKGQKLDEYLAQRDAFDQIKPDVDGFIRNFYDPGGKRAKSAARIADFLRIYANEAAKVSAEAGLDLGLPKVTPHDIQAAASAKSAPAGNRVRPSEQNERPPKRGRGTGEGGAAASAEQLPGSEPRRGFAESDELFASEPGADNKPQLVLPGAERIASADLAKRRAAEPLRPKKAQKAPDEGLFAPPVEKQIDLEEAIAANKGAPPAAPEPKKVSNAAPSPEANHNDRPTVALHRPGDMGAIFGEARTPAEWYAREAPNDQTREAMDRGIEGSPDIAPGTEDNGPGYRDANGLRASLAKAERERGERLGEKGLREGPSLSPTSDEENGAPRGAVSVSGKPRAETHPYGNAPDNLMGFRKEGPQRGYDETKYRREQPVKVTFPDGPIFFDAIKGSNKPHAMERARRNWEGAKIEPAQWSDVEKQDQEDRARETGPSDSLLEGRGPTPEEAQEHVRLGDFETRHGVPLGRQAQEYVVGHGRATGNEHLLAFDEGGHAVAHGYGTPRNTGITPEFEAALRDPKNAIVAHHNHPSNSGLSGVDISFLATPGLHSIWAHGHEGTVARASLTVPARKALSLEEIDPGVRRLHWIADSVSNFLLPVIQRFVDAKYIGRDEGHLAITDLVGRALHRAGIIDYRSNVELPKAISETSLGPYIERAAQWAAGSLFNDKIQTSAGRQPEPLRHIGDLGTSLGRPQEVARRYAAQERPDQGGRAHDRAESAPTGRLAFAEGANPFTREAGGGGAGGPPKGGHPSGPAPQDPLHPASWSIRRKLADMLGSDAALTAKEKLQDFNARVERLQNMVEARSRNWVDPEGSLPDNQQFYTLKRLFPGKRANRMREFDQKFVKPLDEILRGSNVSGNEAGRYLYAKHAIERNRAVGALHPANSDFNRAIKDPNLTGASGMSAKEARAIIDKAEKGPNASTYKTLAEAAADIRNFAQSEMLRGGLESQDTLSEWNRIYEHYVPLRGWEDPGEERPFANQNSGRGSGDIKGPESKRALGRATKADNPLVGLIDQAYRTIDRAERNLALQGLARMLNAAGSDVRKEMGITLERGRPKRVIDPTTGLVKTVEDNFDRMRDNAVHMKVRGNDQYVVFDDVRLAQAAKRWSPASNSGLAFMNRLMSKWKSALTHYNPLFMPRHMARYYVEGMLNAIEQKEHGEFSVIKYAADAFPLIGTATRAILARERGMPAGKIGEHWDEMKAGGGATSMFSMRDYDELLERLRSEAASIGTSKYSPQKALHVVSEFVDKFTGVIDNSTRLSAFTQAREAGKTIQQASMIAREATVDYNLRGLLSNWLAIWAPFQNVATQTGYRMGSALYRSRIMRKVFLGTFALGFASSVWNYFVGGQDEEGVAFFDKIPEWTRTKALAMFAGLSDDKGRPQPIIWPFPFNWVLPLTWGQAVGGMAFGTAPKARYLAMMLSSFVSSFSELGEQGVAWRDISPEMMRPFMDVALNKSWTGAHIHAFDEFQRGPNSESGFQWTPEYWKSVAQFLNHYTGGDEMSSGYLDFYPEDISYIMKSYLGGQVRPAEETAAAISALQAGEPVDPTQIPIGSVFYGTNYDKADQAREREQRFNTHRPWLGRDDEPRKPLINLGK